MSVIVRRAREDDAEAIASVLKPIIQAGTCTIMDEVVTVEVELAFIRGLPQRGILNVAVDGGQIVGLQDVLPLATESGAFRHVGEISTFVSLEARRRGIGRSLSQAMFAAAGERGFRKLTASIRADNPHAVAFYRSQGFSLIGTARAHAFTGGRYVDEILMDKLIDEVGV